MASEAAFVYEVTEIVEMCPVVGFHLREEVVRVDVDQCVPSALDLSAELFGTIRVGFPIEGRERRPNCLLRLPLGFVRCVQQLKSVPPHEGQISGNAADRDRFVQRNCRR